MRVRTLVLLFVVVMLAVAAVRLRMLQAADDEARKQDEQASLTRDRNRGSASPALPVTTTIVHERTPAEVACDNATTINQSALAFAKAGDLVHADDESAHAVKLCPSDDVLQKNRARILLQRVLKSDDKKLKLELLNESLQLESSKGGHVLRGELRFDDNDVRGAVDDLTQASALDPDDDKLKARLAQVQKQAHVEGGFQDRQAQHFVALFEGYAQEQLAWTALDVLEHAYFGVGSKLNLYPKDPVTVVIYTGDQYSQATGTPDWSAGAFDGKIRIRQGDLALARGSLESVLTHEYVHAALHTSVHGRIPSWFHEGTAQMLAGETQLAKSHLVDEARAHHALMPLSSLQLPFTGFADAHTAQLAYAEALALVQAMVDRRGAYALQLLVVSMINGKSFEEAFREVFAIDLNQFEASFRG